MAKTLELQLLPIRPRRSLIALDWFLFASGAFQTPSPGTKRLVTSGNFPTDKWKSVRCEDDSNKFLKTASLSVPRMQAGFLTNGDWCTLGQLSYSNGHHRSYCLLSAPKYANWTLSELFTYDQGCTQLCKSGHRASFSDQWSLALCLGFVVINCLYYCPYLHTASHLILMTTQRQVLCYTHM